MAFPKNKNISVSLVSGMGFIQPRSMIKFQKVWAFYGNFGKAYQPKQRASSKTEAEFIKTLPWPAIGKEFPQDQSTIVGSYHPTTFYILYQYLNLGYLGFFSILEKSLRGPSECNLLVWYDAQAPQCCAFHIRTLGPCLRFWTGSFGCAHPVRPWIT